MGSEIQVAVDAAIRLVTVLNDGSPAVEALLARLRTLIIGFQEVEGVVRITYTTIANSVSNLGTNAIENFVQSVSDGQNVFRIST